MKQVRCRNLYGALVVRTKRRGAVVLSRQQHPTWLVYKACRITAPNIPSLSAFDNNFSITPIPPMWAAMDNTVYVVTGANRGLGLGLVQSLLARP